MKVKKLVVATALTSLAALSLASCGGSGNKVEFDDSIIDSVDLSQPIEIEFWHTMGKPIQEILTERITEFNKIYPNITIKHKQIGGYNDVKDQIVQNFGTQAYPNLAYCYPDHVALYNEAQITVALDGLANNAKYGFGGSELTTKFAEVDATPIKESDLVSSFYQEGKQFGDGKTYTLPFLKSTEVLYYNVDFFTEHSLTVPTTWDEMWDTCAKIKEIDPNSVPLGYDSADNLFITLAQSYGYEYTSNNSFDFNNEGMRNLVKEFRGYYDKGYFTTKLLNGDQYTSNVFKDSTASNRMYMCVGSSAGASNQKASNKAFQVGVAGVPSANGKELKAISQGPSLTILKSDDPAKVVASWIFAQYLLTDFSQAAFALATGYLPVTTTSIKIDAYEESMNLKDGYDHLPETAASFANSHSNMYFTSSVFIGSSIAREQCGSLFNQVMADNSINSSNIDSKIQTYFDEAIQKCKYESGL